MRVKQLYIVIFSVLCFVRLDCFGQSDLNIDSLNKVILHTKIDTVKVRSLLSLGWHYRAIDSKKAQELTLTAIDLAIKGNYKRGEGYAYVNLGGIYIFSLNYSKASENLLKALPIVESLNDSLQMGMAYNNLALVYTEQLNYELAKTYYEKAFEIKKAKRNKRGMAATLHNLGMLYAYQRKYDKAKEYFDQSLKLELEVNNSQGIAECYQSLGNIAVYDKKYNNAVKFYNRALSIYDSINDIENLGGCLSGISEVFSEVKKYRKAIEYGLKSLELTEKYKIDREDSYRALVMAYEGAGKAEEALKYQRKLMSMKDSIYNVELAGKTVEIQTKYEAEKKEKEILLLEKQNTESSTLAETRKLWFIIAIISGLLAVAILLLVLLRISSLKKQKQIEFEKSKLEFEQKALRAQMNPHFLFNAINSIQSYILNKKQQEAYDYLAKFSKLMRIVLNNSQEKTLNLHSELEMIKLYVEMEQLRFNESFDFNLSVAQDIDVHDVILPAMLIQPYIENAIWHGLMNLANERRGILNLKLTIQDTLLKIVVEDNGVGREKAKEYKKDDAHKSVGMNLTEQRLLLMGKMEEYEKAKVIVSDVKDEKDMICGTRVEIFIPVNGK